jgi:hypothetical protein
MNLVVSLPLSQALFSPSFSRMRPGGVVNQLNKINFTHHPSSVRRGEIFLNLIAEGRLTKMTRLVKRN